MKLNLGGWEGRCSQAGRPSLTRRLRYSGKEATSCLVTSPPRVATSYLVTSPPRGATSYLVTSSPRGATSYLVTSPPLPTRSIHRSESNPNSRDITRNVEENEKLHEIFSVVSRFPSYISCYISENRLPLGQPCSTNCRICKYCTSK